jgi:signal transduction histidine kinase
MTQVIVLDNSFKKTSLNPYLVATDLDPESWSTSIYEIQALPESVWQKVPADGFKKPYDRRFWFLRFEVDCEKTGYYYLENQYTMLEEFSLFLQENGGETKDFGNQGVRIPTGNSSFFTRYPMFRVHLRAGKKYTFYLRLNKTFAASNQPLFLYTSREYFERNSKDERQYGIIYGVIFVLLFMGLITGFFFKSRIYFYYALYMLGLAGILFVSNGLYRILLPEKHHLIGYFTLYYFILCTFFGLYLMLYKLFDIRSEFPVLHKFILVKVILSVFSSVLNTFAFLYWPSYPLLFYKISIVFIILYPLVMIGICIAIYYKKRVQKALYFLLIFIFTLIFTALFSLLPFTLISHNQLMTFRWIIVFEGVAVLLILHRDLYLSKIQTIQLQDVLIKEQQKSVELYLKGLSDERNRISQELHDSISARLSALGMRINYDKQQPFKENHDFYISELREIQEHVRTTSHDLSPISLARKNIIQAFEDEIIRLELVVDDIAFEFTHDAVEQFEDLTQNQKELFFWTFSELIQNVLKHAQSNWIGISLNFSDDQYLLSVEDHGIGYDPERIPTSGLGLETIFQRARLGIGKFEISRTNQGMKHRFSLPKIHHTNL